MYLFGVLVPAVVLFVLFSKLHANEDGSKLSISFEKDRFSAYLPQGKRIFIDLNKSIQNTQYKITYK